MDETYDAIVLGTGLKECILSGLLSVDGLKVLHLDRNPYYGGASASLNLNQLYERHAPKPPPPPPVAPRPPAPEAATTTTAEGGEEQGAAAAAAAPPPPPPPQPAAPPAPSPPAHLGPSRDYNVDTVPKFIMGGGKLVRVLVRTKVTRYLEFKAVDGSFVFSAGRVERVPATDMEALRSPLLGLLEKRRARNFFIFVQDYREEDPRTHGGRDLRRMPTAALYAEFGLAPATVDFVGHALALHTDDTYMNRPALDTVKRIQLYHDSLFRYEGVRSPYMYPMYGLGELPQAFARLAAVHGGTYMLNQPDAEVVFEDGKAVGVKTAAGTAKATLAVVGDPSYFPGRCLRSSRVVRATCILSHPLPGTADAASCQVIVPQKQVSPPRRSDVYVFCCSATHAVAPRGRWLAFVSTTVETQNPEAELAPGLALLGAIDAKFVEVVDVLEPEDSGSSSRAFISRGYDATTHFESTVDDVLEMYTRITGKVIDLDAVDPDKANDDD